MARPEPPPGAGRPLGDLPLHLAGAWEGSEIGIDARTLELLQLTDHVMRVYLPVAGRADGGRRPEGIGGPRPGGIGRAG